MPGYQGNASYTNEEQMAPYARAVKSYDSTNTTRVLFYQNGLINFPQTTLSKTIPESYLLHDKKGRLVYLGGCGSSKSAPNHTVFDHTQSASSKMWMDNIVQVVQANSGLVDGVFCDRSGSLSDVLAKDLHCYDFDAGLAHAWDKGHWQTLANTQAALNEITPKAIVVGNHASPTGAMGLTPGSGWDAKMFEHFIPTRPYLPAGNQLTNLIKEHQQINEVHVDFCRKSKVGNSSEGNLMYNRSLAAFLIGASNHSYYACTEGWGFDKGWSNWSPDFDRPLGAPVAAAGHTSGGVYHRKFASGTAVWLNTQVQRLPPQTPNAKRRPPPHTRSRSPLTPHTARLRLSESKSIICALGSPPLPRSPPRTTLSLSGGRAASSGRTGT
jgi:hypothetical protein